MELDLQERTEIIREETPMMTSLVLCGYILTSILASIQR